MTDWRTGGRSKRCFTHLKYVLCSDRPIFLVVLLLPCLPLLLHLNRIILPPTHLINLANYVIGFIELCHLCRSVLKNSTEWKCQDKKPTQHLLVFCQLLFTADEPWSFWLPMIWSAITADARSHAGDLWGLWPRISVRLYSLELPMYGPVFMQLSAHRMFANSLKHNLFQGFQWWLSSPFLIQCNFHVRIIPIFY